MGTLKEKVYRLNAAVNDHDLNPIGDMYAADAELVWPGLGPTKGREAVVGFYATLLGAFPVPRLHGLRERARLGRCGLATAPAGLLPMPVLRSFG